MPKYAVAFLTTIIVSDVTAKTKQEAIKAAYAKYTENREHYEQSAKRSLSVKRMRGGE